jgi:hypothetical protein
MMVKMPDNDEVHLRRKEAEHENLGSLANYLFTHIHVIPSKNLVENSARIAKLYERMFQLEDELSAYPRNG